MNIEPSSNSRRAKLFLSCGQNPNHDELRWGEAVRNALDFRFGGLGFDVFYAKGQQEPLSLTQVIFRELENADYYVLLDFKREALAIPNEDQQTSSNPSVTKGSAKRIIHRGSLFTHQEFAIACYLGLEIAAFREGGEGEIEPLTGVVGAVMGNPILFERTSLACLANLVADYIRTRSWSLESRGQLRLIFAEDPIKVDKDPVKGSISYYHINVSNLHHRRPATNCYAYVDKIIDAATGITVGPKFTCELKWEGTLLQGIRIAPCSQRGLDAFVFHHDHQQVIFWPQTDATNHIDRFPATCELLVTYIVCCDEFPDSRQTFRVSSKGNQPVRVIAVSE